MIGTGEEIRLLATADLLLLVSRLLQSPARIEPEALEALAAEALAAEALAAQLGDAGDHRLGDLLAATLEAARRTDREAWSLEHTRLFEGAVACPINETAYVRRDKGVIIADLCGFYVAFGFEPAERSGEKPDHLACELEFAAVLSVMLAQARGDAEHEQITRDALRDFLMDHPGQWITLVAQRLDATTRLPMLQGVAALLGACWDVAAVPLGLPPAAALAVEDPVPEPEEGTPYECGMVDAGDQPVTLTGPPGSDLPQHGT